MTDTPTYAQLVARVGELLYGREWVQPLATELGAVKRTVERVAAAAREGRDYPAAKAWLDDLQKLAAERRDQLHREIEELIMARGRRAAEKAARRP